MSPAPHQQNIDAAAATGRPQRLSAATETLHNTIAHPGNVYINVQGAYIADDDQPKTPLSIHSDDYESGGRDIRLPNHTDVVSHIAVDVSFALALSRARALAEEDGD